MRIIFISFLIISFLNNGFAQRNFSGRIKRYQNEKFKTGVCLDFIRAGDIEGIDAKHLQQIIIIRHGEPAMNKKGWKNREEAIKYTKMYDSVGVYDFEEKPVCLRNLDKTLIYSSKLPRAISTAEKTIEGEMPVNHMAIFNEFERKVIEFPNIKLPRQFWSVTTRAVWMMGFNDKGIETFRKAKDRSKMAASFLDHKSENNENVLLFAHGFLNKYVKRYLKKSGYYAINLDGQKYLGAYYFYKIKMD